MVQGVARIPCSDRLKALALSEGPRSRSISRFAFPFAVGAGIPVVCIANKVDVDPNVTQKEFAFPRKHNLDFFYCSAADGTNVVAAFETAIAKAVMFSKQPPEDFVDQVMKLLDNDTALGNRT